jgi:hypothetical protein
MEAVASLALRPFFWRRGGATLQSLLALANPEHRIPSLRMRRLAQEHGTVKARAGAVSPSFTAPKWNEVWHRIDGEKPHLSNVYAPNACKVLA